MVGSNLTIDMTAGGALAGGAGSTNGNAVTFLAGTNVLSLGATATGATLTGNLAVVAQGSTLQINAAAGGSTLANVITGAGGLIQNSANTLTLTGVNTYTGGTTLTSGILSIGADANLGANSGKLTFNGGTLETTANITTARAVAINNSGTVQTDAGVATTFTGVVADGTGAGTLTKTGTGTFTLTAANIYTGGTTNAQGTLINNGSLVSQVTNYANAIFVNNGTLAANHTNAGTSTNNGAIGGTVTNTGTFTNSVSGVVSGKLLNSAGTATNNGILFSEVTNNVGAIFVNNRTVLANHTNAGISTNNGTIGDVGNGGSFTNNGSAGGVGNSGSFTNNGSAGGVGNSGIATNNGRISGGVTNTRTFTNSASGLVNAGLLNTAGTSTNAGTINEGATVNGGVLTTSGRINGGVVNVAVVNAQGTINGDVTNRAGSTFTLTGALTDYGNGGAMGIGRLTNDGTFDLGGRNLTIGSLAGSTPGATIANGGILTTGIDGTSSEYAGGIVGLATALTKQGEGTFTLSGNNTYVGITTIQTGTLAVSGAGIISRSSQVLNNANFTIAAGGQVTTPTVTNNGTFSTAGLVNTALFTNNASVNLTAGTLSATTFANTSDGVNGTNSVFNAQGGAILSGTFQNNGQFNLLGDVDGSVANFNNAGSFNLAASKTLSGIGTFDNSGTIGITSGGPFQSTIGAASFNNGSTGRINLAGNVDPAGKPVTTDSLTLTGNYQGTPGSRILVDVDLTSVVGTRADQLLVKGSGGGTTTLVLTRTNPDARSGVFFSNPINVVSTAGGKIDLSVLDPAASQPGTIQGNGFITYKLQQSGGDYQIVSQIRPDQAATSVAGITGLITSLNVGFFQSISAFISGPAEHKICTEELGNAKLCEQPNSTSSVGVTSTGKSWAQLNQQAAAAPVAADANVSGILPDTYGLGLWARGSGGETTIRSTSTATIGGTTLQGDNRTRIGFAGMQFGGDFAVFNIRDTGFNLHMGVTGGEIYANGRELLSSQATGAFSVPFVGAYAAVTSGAFTSDIAYRHDFYNARINDTASGVMQQRLSIGSDTVAGSAGYRIDLPGLFGGDRAYFLEPSGSMSYTQTRIGVLGVTGGALSFQPIDSILGRFGVRAGTTFVAGETLAVQPFVTLSVWNEFAGNAASRFTAASIATDASNFVPILTNRVGTFGQVGLGITGQILGTDLLGYVRGDLRFGDRIDGYSINGGVRYPF
ncbi:hypothetical protein AFCDBAGC_3491 [Methylobacterium cerastii]|uniref:Autotransporter domain-containing protein n=1 Tax=Methylobacterium cerastii TaxID=932741 RepID=A0ABQ4QKD1_9HYPH|nr:autotransporter-associated beta strand repeat-containing protein [Methylobacterium cerastii]GJD45617.1 hypothetical protein AFCDBAGC_3491 [Methylobacterium cerastii]